MISWMREVEKETGVVHEEKYCSQKELREGVEKFMQTEIDKVLTPLGWRVLPQWSAMELLYLTGLLHGAPR